jgi:hypothetical protein
MKETCHLYISEQGPFTENEIPEMFLLNDDDVAEDCEVVENEFLEGEYNGKVGRVEGLGIDGSNEGAWSRK